MKLRSLRTGTLATQAMAGTTIFNSFNAPKLTGISQLNNFTFSEGVVARRAYEIGEGKFLPWSSLDSKS